jgi:hypothetical protein
MELTRATVLVGIWFVYEMRAKLDSSRSLIRDIEFSRDEFVHPFEDHHQAEDEIGGECAEEEGRPFSGLGSGHGSHVRETREGGSSRDDRDDDAIANVGEDLFEDAASQWDIRAVRTSSRNRDRKYQYQQIEEKAGQDRKRIQKACDRINSETESCGDQNSAQDHGNAKKEQVVSNRWASGSRRRHGSHVGFDDRQDVCFVIQIT